MDLGSDYGNAGSRTFTLLQLATEMLSSAEVHSWRGSGSDEASGRFVCDVDDLEAWRVPVDAFADAKVGQLAGADLNQITLLIVVGAAGVGDDGTLRRLLVWSQRIRRRLRRCVWRRTGLSQGEKKQAIFSSAWGGSGAKVCARFGGGFEEPVCLRCGGILLLRRRRRRLRSLQGARRVWCLRGRPGWFAVDAGAGAAENARGGCVVCGWCSWVAD